MRNTRAEPPGIGTMLLRVSDSRDLSDLSNEAHAATFGAALEDRVIR
jgi:hypothetical protein